MLTSTSSRVHNPILKLVSMERTRCRPRQLTSCHGSPPCGASTALLNSFPYPTMTMLTPEICLNYIGSSASVGMLVTPRSAIRPNGYKDALISGRYYGASAPYGGQLVLHVNTRPMDIYLLFSHTTSLIYYLTTCVRFPSRAAIVLIR
jgi:hypothetical protein